MNTELANELILARSHLFRSLIFIGEPVARLVSSAPVQDKTLYPALVIDQEKLASGDCPVLDAREAGQQHLNAPSKPAGASLADLAMQDAELTCLREFPFMKASDAGAAHGLEPGGEETRARALTDP